MDSLYRNFLYQLAEDTGFDKPSPYDRWDAVLKSCPVGRLKQYSRMLETYQALPLLEQPGKKMRLLETEIDSFYSVLK